MGMLSRFWAFVYSSGKEEAFWSTVKWILSRMGLAAVLDSIAAYLVWNELRAWQLFVLLVFITLAGIWIVNGIMFWLYRRRENGGREAATHPRQSIESIPNNEVDTSISPEPIFACPIQRAQEDDLSWWHIPIWLKKRGNSPIESYQRCTATLIFEEQGFFPHSQLDLRCQSPDNPAGDREFPLRVGDDRKLLIVAKRSEIVDKDSQVCPVYFTDQGYLINGVRQRLEHGIYRFHIELRCGEERWQSEPYVLTVPGPRMSNGHFILLKI